MSPGRWRDVAPGATSRLIGIASIRLCTMRWGFSRTSWGPSPTRSTIRPKPLLCRSVQVLLSRGE